MATIGITEDAPRLHGGALEFWQAKDHEIILSGPYETGKTFAALYKLHALLSLYKNASALMVRKTYRSLRTSAMATYERKVLVVPPSHPKSAIKPYGGEAPDFYQYPNGSRLNVGGMDNADKFLSAEFDFIYVNQAEELFLDDWEKLAGRATGARAMRLFRRLWAIAIQDHRRTGLSKGNPSACWKAVMLTTLCFTIRTNRTGQRRAGGRYLFWTV
ncbi:MAG: hypothetical protein IPJ48_17835 [Propionivibrio sp.]|uniref:Uncharacterized protein n=1 Tax=Candidatus Propionivibrio dominans TaxID=2954373 RepID=A0A9D7I8X1_9RHOO|nr:hypothetical protein [Candidatus Propionivibrio dominans]